MGTASADESPAIGQICPSLAPLIRKGYGAGGGDGEGSVGTGKHDLGCGFGSDYGRYRQQRDGEGGDGARGRGGDIAGHNEITPSIVRLQIGDGEVIGSCAGDAAAIRQVQSIEEPAIT